MLLPVKILRKINSSYVIPRTLCCVAYSSVVVGGTIGTVVNLKSRAKRAEQSASSLLIHVQNTSHCALVPLDTISNKNDKKMRSI